MTGSEVGFNSNFGKSVLIYNSTAIVGFPNRNSGYAFIFERDKEGANNCGETIQIIPSDDSTGDNFGESVAISGNKTIVGAYQDDDACPEDIGCNSGAAYIFNLSSDGITDEDRD